jgi:hypothetical protein
MHKFLRWLTAAALVALCSIDVARAQIVDNPSPMWPRNMLVCGDATTCPWQRGTSFASIANTGTMTADYWEAIGGASSNITISQATQTGVNGFAKAMKFARTSANTNTAVVNLGQVLDSGDFGTSLQGKTVCLSFDSLAGANFSAANSVFSYSVFAGTGSNEGYASMVAGTWTGTATVMTGTVTEGTTAQSTVQCAQVPSTATEVGLNFFWTPVGTAGANDWVELLRIQLEAVNPALAAHPQPTTFENHTATQELALAQQRAYVLTEPAASISVSPSGQGASTTTCVLSIPFPVAMRAAPTLTAIGTALAATTWTVTHVVTNTVLSTPFLATTTGGNTKLNANLTATTGATLTAGQTCTLTGAGGGSILVWSADLT